jgi:uncharacterized protein YmfQ (DUF2313 family)
MITLVILIAMPLNGRSIEYTQSVRDIGLEIDMFYDPMLACVLMRLYFGHLNVMAVMHFSDLQIHCSPG